jgi:integrase
MALIYRTDRKSKNGKSFPRWVVDWREPDGKRRRQVFADIAAAKAHRGLIESGRSTNTELSGHSFAEAAADFIESRKRLGRERSTWLVYACHLRIHLGPLIGARDIAELRRSDFVRLQEDLLSKLSHALAKAVFVTARAIMAHTVQREWRVSDPARDVRFVKSGREKPRIEVPDKAKIHRLLEALGASKVAAGEPPTRGYVFVRLALGSGMRASELRGLRVSDVRLEAAPQTVTVAQRADQWRRIGPPKSRNGRRTIPIGPDLAELLRRWIPLRRHPTSPLLFPTDTGAPMDMSNFHVRIWKPAMRRAGLLDPATGRTLWTFHFLRHIYASQLIELKVNLKQVQMRLGHGSIQMTLDVYGHLWRDLEKETQEVAEFERRMLGHSGPRTLAFANESEAIR